jgi:hypothetical protein
MTDSKRSTVLIIERSMNGTMEAHNIDGGAEFVVSIPQGTAPYEKQ